MSEKKEKVPTKYYEIVDRKSSGFILSGTEGTQHQQELTAPSVQWIPSSGKAIDPNTKHGFREVRWINGCNTIDPMEQEKLGLKPNRFEDKIPMVNGYATVERSGNTIGLYDFLEVVFYNQEAPGRPSTASTRFREVKVNKKAEVLLDEDEILTKAKSIIYGLRRNTGNNAHPYKYDDDRIDAICRIVGVWDESPETKLIKLIREATIDPKRFVSIVTLAEQTVVTEVSHALQTGVIKFDGNSVLAGDRILTTLGSGKMSDESKIERFASWLATSEGTQSLTELRANLELAKEQLLK